MPSRVPYKDYFDIDPKYYAAVTPELVESGKVSWKNFYPHDTFVMLLKEVNQVLNKTQSGSVWVEGAYGTGKSHAVFTIKKMLEASDEEIEAYFNDFNLSNDLCKQLITGRNAGKLLIVQRTGSSDIHSDNNLINKMQESIMAALKAAGIENKGEASLKGKTLEWLEKDANRIYFASLMSEERYAWDFNGKSIDEVMQILREGSEIEISRYMINIMKVAEDNNLLAMQIDAPAMADWITDIIKKNNLGGIIFIWDEFTEYFKNNGNSLTGFQTLAALSQTVPFYFMIVTHGSEQLVANYPDVKKIHDRFLPEVKIELPDNIAFRLMKQAMRTTSDSVLSATWKTYAKNLNNNLETVRKEIVKITKNAHTGALKDEDLTGIVPMHPFAALLLKHISVVVGSNQRSMFEFIINNNPDAQSFKWYIENYSPLDNKNILTIDMLWNFFNLKGQNGQETLNHSVRMILSNYYRHDMDKYTEDEQRVFKTLLLLQAISAGIGQSGARKGEGAADVLLRPNDSNLEWAFSGTDWQQHKATALAEGLVKDNLLFKQVVGKNTEYTVAGSGGDAGEIEKEIAKILSNMKTSEMSARAGILEGVNSALPQKIKNRFVFESVTVADSMTKKANIMANDPYPHKFRVAVVFALNEDESQKVRKEIEALVKDDKYANIYFIDATSKFFGEDNKKMYASDLAYSNYYLKSDKKQSDQYGARATETLSSWRSDILNGSFTLYGKEFPSGIRAANITALEEELLHIEEKVYPYSLAKFNVIDNMFKAGAMGQGAGCGINEKIEGTYRSSNKQTQLDNALMGVWQVKDYWKDPEKQNLPIVRAKLLVEELIDEGFNNGGRISIKKIFEELQGGKFGYIPCNLTAFVLGFLLKEYADSKYFCSNDLNSVPMSSDTLKKMIVGVLNPPKNYKEEFIVAMSPESAEFLAATSKIFKIPPNSCGSVDLARNHVRIEMRKKQFPIWCVKSVLSQKTLGSNAELAARVIDLYLGIANNANMGGASETDLANEIGRKFIDNPVLVQDLETLFKNEVVVEGMKEYIKNFKGGELVNLAAKIGNSANYLADVKDKFSGSDANWVWNTETADEKLSDIILEYSIVDESNKSLPKTSTLKKAVQAWNQKTGNIKISYEALIPEAGELKELLSLLYKMKSQGSLPDSEKNNFYEELIAHREDFESFYNGQLSYFKNVAKVFLDDLDDVEIEELFNKLGTGQFTKPKGDYFRYIEGEIKKYSESRAKTKLRNLWQQKTNTKSPVDWSRQYRTPVLCMFDDDERGKMREIFKTMQSATDKDELDAAYNFLEKANFYDRLKTQGERDRLFIERVVGEDYSVILTDANAVRDYLSNNLSTDPYYWMDSSEVKSKLKAFAQKEYALGSCEKALEVIDELSINDLRDYLRELVEDLNVGIGILKHKAKN